MHTAYIHATQVLANSMSHPGLKVKDKGESAALVENISLSSLRVIVIIVLDHPDDILGRDGHPGPLLVLVDEPLGLGYDQDPSQYDALALEYRVPLHALTSGARIHL